MGQGSVQIPAGLVAPVRDSVALLYRAAVEGLHFALAAADGVRGPQGEVSRQRERVHQLDALLVQLGWWGEPPPGHAGGLEVSGPQEILHDALYGALIDAGERLAVACGDSWGGAGLGAVRSAAREVIALDRLLTRLRG